MNKKCVKSVQRLLALVLCVAMLLPVFPQAVRAEDVWNTLTGTDSITGYEGVTGAKDQVSVVTAAANPVATTTPQIQFNRVNGSTSLIQEGRYLLMSDKYGYIMYFDATATPQVPDRNDDQYGSRTAGSIQASEDGALESYYISGNTVYLDQSNRHFVLWNLRQYKEVSGSEIANGGNLKVTKWANYGQAAATDKNQGTIYQGIELQKRPNTYGSYWFCKDQDASEDYQLRFLCYRVDSTPFKNNYRNSLQTEAADRPRYMVESVGDNTFLIYYKANDAGTDYRFLVCDSEGTWSVVRYKDNQDGANPLSQITTDLEELKVRLYQYAPASTKKNVAFSGYKTYAISQNSSATPIINAIVDNSTVFDPNRDNQQIPYSGISGKVGYYWLDISQLNTASVSEQYIYVKYRNDDNTDTLVTTLTIQIEAPVIENIATSGIVSQRSYSEVHVNENTRDTATFTYNGEVISITAMMLTHADGSAVDTSISDTYENLVLTYNGWVLTDSFTLTVGKGTIPADMPIYPEPGSVRVTKESTTSNEEFAATGVANIELSATAKPMPMGIDLVIMMDLSSSMRYYTNSNSYACGQQYRYDGSVNDSTLNDRKYAYKDEWWADTRMAALENSLKNVVSELRATNADVRIALADFGDLNHFEFENAVIDKNYREYPVFERDGEGLSSDNVNYRYEMTNHLNFVMGSTDIETDKNGEFTRSQPYSLDVHKWYTDYDATYGGYSGKIAPMIYTDSDTTKNYMVDAEAFVHVDDLDANAMNEIIVNMRKQNSKLLGTNYDVGLEYAYRLAQARQQANINAGVERDIVVIFMSDGAAMQYNYFSGRAMSEAWSQYLIGEVDSMTATPFGWGYDVNDARHYEVDKQLDRLHDLLRAGSLKIPNDLGLGSKGTYNKCHCASAAAATAGDFFAHMAAYNESVSWYRFFRILYANSDDNTVRNVVKILKAPTTGTYQTYSPYSYFYNQEGQNWWAEAIKGSTDKVYPVINILAKNATYWPDNLSRNAYNGEEGARDKFAGATTEGLALKGKDYISGYKGLGLDLYTIGFSMDADDNKISAEEAYTVLDNVANAPGFHLSANSESTLTTAIQEIIKNSSVAASKSFFTDTMGVDYDLSTEKTVTDDKGNVIRVNGNPTIRVLKYNLDENNQRTGDPEVLETITFKGGKVAVSDKVDSTDIWNDSTGMIVGKIVQYNTNKYVDENNTGAVQITFGSQGKYTLPAETFFWTIGFLDETEVVLEYQAYLTGSIENELPYGTYDYDTNVKADLGYVDYLGNNCVKNTVTPDFPWTEKAKVSYVFYLVDEDGNLIDVNGNSTENFSEVKMLYTSEFQWISDDTGLDASALFPGSGLAGEYELVNSDATYDVLLNEVIDGEYYHYWESSDGTNTTYVTTFEIDANGNIVYTNSHGNKDSVRADEKIDESTVYFAVKVKKKPTVDYVYYLVNDQGKFLDKDGNIVDDISKAHKLNEAVPQIVDGDTANLDADKLFTGSEYDVKYDLYDPDASFDAYYDKEVGGQTYNYWNTSDSKDSTYVTTDGGVNFSNQDTNFDATAPDADMLQTTVYFAVTVPKVGYSFYLVDENGKPIAADGTVVDSFGDCEKVIDPVYQNVMGDTVGLDAQELFDNSDLSDLYELYSPSATYDVYYGKDVEGEKYNYWESSDPMDSTYVTTDGGTSYTKENTNLDDVTPGESMPSSTVYYALRLKEKASADVIVIDFGIPVKIDVLHNDDLSDNSTVVGICKDNTVLAAGTAPTDSFSAAGVSVSDTFGSIVFASGENLIKYTLNSMEMNDTEVFTYVAKDAKYGYHYYSTVTVIPATTIYYEDSFVTTTAYDSTTGKEVNAWTTAGTLDSNAVQDQDRPKADTEDALGNLDADNVYGSDSAYTNYSTYSLGQSKKVTVNASTYAKATFSFWGTGFDVVSLTSKDTGVILVTVYEYDVYQKYLNDKAAEDAKIAAGQTIAEEDKVDINDYATVKNLLVDTYYGYKYENGNWVVDSDNKDTLYQVPVIKANLKEYKHYTAVITASYASIFDHNDTDASYDFYLDAIRIYDPANDGNGNSVIQGAYTDDKEGWPEYFELRNLIISRGDLDYTVKDTNKVAAGVVFIDNTSTDEFDVSDYKNYGPNNELYLASNQTIVFDLSAPKNFDAIQIAMKSVGAGTAKVKFSVLENGVLKDVAGHEYEIKTATDLYYDISNLNGKTIVISSEGAAILSITNVKITYKSQHSDSLEQSYFTANSANVIDVLTALNNKTEDDANASVDNDGIALTNASLSLEDEVMVNFYYTIDSSKISNSSIAEKGLLIWNSKVKESDALYENADSIVNGALYDSTNKVYMTNTPGIAAKNLGDDLYVRVFVKTTDGTYKYSKLVVYSPKTYAYNRLANSNNAKMKALCVALLNYGAAAQEYFNYKTDALMNAALTAKQKALVVEYKANLFQGSVSVSAAKASSFTATTKGFDVAAASVSFDGAFSINYYFTPKSTVNGNVTFYYWTAEDYAKVSKLTTANSSGTMTMVNTGNGRYWADITGIAAKQIDETFYVVAVYTDTNGNSHCSGVIAYSLSAYCMNNADSESMGSLAKTTAMYGYYAADYFKKES